MAEEAEEKKAEEILEEIKELLKEEKESYLITFPANGGTESIAVGTTTLDFVEGDVTLPDGTEKKMSGSLKQYGEDYMRSVFLEVSQDYVWELDDSGKFTSASSKKTMLKKVQFKRLTITVTTAGTLKMVASTNAEMELNIVS